MQRNTREHDTDINGSMIQLNTRDHQRSQNQIWMTGYSPALMHWWHITHCIAAVFCTSVLIILNTTASQSTALQQGTQQHYTLLHSSTEHNTGDTTALDRANCPRLEPLHGVLREVHSTCTVYTQYIHSTYTTHTQHIHNTYTLLRTALVLSFGRILSGKIWFQ